MFLSPKGIDFKKVEEINNISVSRTPDQAIENRMKSFGKSLIRGYMPLNANGRKFYSPLRQYRGNPDYKIKFLPAGGVRDEKDNLLIDENGKLIPLLIPMLKINQILYGNKYANEDWIFNRIKKY
jgi:hypothetical protein